MANEVATLEKYHDFLEKSDFYPPKKDRIFGIFPIQNEPEFIKEKSMREIVKSFHSYVQVSPGTSVLPTSLALRTEGAASWALWVSPGQTQFYGDTIDEKGEPTFGELVDLWPKKVTSMESEIEKKASKASNVLMSGIGSVVGAGLLFTGIFFDYVYAVAGTTILALSLLHLSWTKKS